jgi:hypothetical protein
MLYDITLTVSNGFGVGETVGDGNSGGVFLGRFVIVGGTPQDVRTKIKNVERMKRCLILDFSTEYENINKYLFCATSGTTVCASGQVGGRGLCLGAEKTQSQKNVSRSRRLPQIHCPLCSAAL